VTETSRAFTACAVNICSVKRRLMDRALRFMSAAIEANRHGIVGAANIHRYIALGFCRVLAYP
jgi:hypothetical protein